MRSKRAINIAVATISITMILMLSAPAFAAVDGEVVVSGKCTACHSDERIKTASKTAAEWTMLVDDEIDRGAQLNGEERTAAINYLVANYSGSSPQQAAMQQTATTSQTTPAEQAQTGVEMWQFIVAGSSFIGTGVYLRRKR